jgi:salicylate hydroxylase
MAQTTSPKVIIVGCGIAGPVIALLLQKKGYTPIILEKVRQLGDAGASLMMQPNG